MKKMRTAKVACLALLAMGTACFADSGVKTESRMFDLVYARADEVADGLNRSWRGQVLTNGTWCAGEIAILRIGPKRRAGSR